MPWLGAVAAAAAVIGALLALLPARSIARVILSYVSVIGLAGLCAWIFDLQDGIGYFEIAMVIALASAIALIPYFSAGSNVNGALDGHF